MTRDEPVYEYNAPGIELLCNVVRSQAASFVCPACHQPLVDAHIEPREVGLDRVVLDVICRQCRARQQVVVAPASEGGVAFVG